MNHLYAVTAIGLVCAITLVVGAFGLRLSRTTSDFYVAGRTVTPSRNASAISGEYLSAASFLGVAGLVYTRGADMLWLPVGYTVGYIVLLTLVAAPLRRSGAYTLPDFAEARLESKAVRGLSSALVIGIGWLYLVPQFQGAGLAMAAVTGWPSWVGSMLVVVVVFLSVAAGGMRSITLVQAMQYWLKLTALAVPACVLLWLWLRDGAPRPHIPADASGDWILPLSGFGDYDHPVYRTYSTLLALCLGTMGLPHVLVRFYTNPDGRAARRTTVAVVGLLGLFYIFTPVYGVLGRVYLPELPAGTLPDSLSLRLPSAMAEGHLAGILGAVLAGGAFAAFLSTASGLAMSVAGAIDQDLLRARLKRITSDDASAITSFRYAAFVAVVVPYALSTAFEPLGLATTVGLAFAVSSATFSPLLVLGIWWRGLSVTGAIAGLVVGAGLATAAIALSVFTSPTGWLGAALAQPGAWLIPLVFAVIVVTSLATPGRIPKGAGRTLVRLHTPESLTGAGHPSRR
ncbi:cation acetate symporter [Actinomycetota bacterium]